MDCFGVPAMRRAKPQVNGKKVQEHAPGKHPDLLLDHVAVRQPTYLKQIIILPLVLRNKFVLFYTFGLVVGTSMLYIAGKYNSSRWQPHESHICRRHIAYDGTLNPKKSMNDDWNDDWHDKDYVALELVCPNRK